MIVVCRHCAKKPSCGRRGLCTGCYRAVRHLYPTLTRFGRRGPAGWPTSPCEPTAYPPGTEEKIEVMIRRVEAREELHHPLDRRAA